ncbi:integrase core domain-containing protein [Streptomyces flaveolus]
MVTGIDDHSRFVVISSVVAVPSARAVCSAFTAAMRRYGVPFEVLTDNGKQFTGRHTRPQPVEVLFERICRENGITQRLAKPRSPTTTGKIERFHRTLREEFLDHVVPFESLAAAQEAIDGWVHAYNHQRPHQALSMATPVSLFRPHTPVRRNDEHPEQTPAEPELSIKVVEPPVLPPQGTAIEFDVRVPPSGEITLVTGRQAASLHPPGTGRPDADGLGEPPQCPLPPQRASRHHGPVPAAAGGHRLPDHALRSPSGRSRAHLRPCPGPAAARPSSPPANPSMSTATSIATGSSVWPAAATRSDSASLATRSPSVSTDTSCTPSPTTP